MKRVISLSLICLASGTPPDPSNPGVPTARMCILRDLGQPDPANRNRTLDPAWSREIGQLTAWGDDFYGTTPGGGLYGKGTAFRISKHGVLKVLYPFRDGLNGAGPQGGLIRGHDGQMWGTTYGGGSLKSGTIFQISPDGGEPKVLMNFRNGSTANLKRPCENQRCPYTPRQIADAAGSFPIGPPVHDGHGNYYGVTRFANNQQLGTLYRLSKPYDSTGYRTLCIFDARMLADTLMKQFVCADHGRFPGGLILGNDGTTLYGTLTRDGGQLFRAEANAGKDIVHVEILRDFMLANAALRFDSGVQPLNLMQASNNRIYGTTYNGGALGQGVVYEYTPSSRKYRVMTSFRIGTFIAGLNPAAGLVEGRNPKTGESDGMLYGTTRYGARFRNGMIYQIPLDGDSMNLRVLHDFGGSSGVHSLTTPVVHTDGFLYGVTYDGGSNRGGVFYRLSELDFPGDTMHDVPMTEGIWPTQEDGKTLVADDLVRVRTDVVATQEWNREGEEDPKIRDGITIQLACRDPHLIQVIYREVLDPEGIKQSGTVTSTTGTYPLSTKAPSWHIDSKNQPNPFFDQAWSPRKIYQHGQTTWLRVFDAPSFGPQLYKLDRPEARVTERFTARVFGFCNCEVKREIQYQIEFKAGKRSYNYIRINPADNGAYTFINEHVEAEGFRKLTPP